MGNISSYLSPAAAAPATQTGGKKKRAQKKKGGALVNMSSQAASIYNTGNLIDDNKQWDAVVNDPLVGAIPLLPTPFSTSIAGVNEGVEVSGTPSLQGGAKKRAKKPAKKNAGKKTSRK